MNFSKRASLRTEFASPHGPAPNRCRWAMAALACGLWFQPCVKAEELRTADQVRRLTAEEAAKGLPVRLRGVVTFFDETLYSRFIQDDTAGIYLRESTNTPGLKPGQVVEVEGRTSPGEYAPIVVPEHVRIDGQNQLPAATLVSFQQLASGQQDSQFVEVEGIVRSVHFEEAFQHHALEIAAGGGRLAVYTRQLPGARGADLVDSTVRVRGVCSTQFNRQRQLFAIRLMVPRPEDLTIETPMSGDPFAIPARSLGSLLQFTPQGSYGHRIKTVGTLVYQQAGNALYIQDETYGLYVQTRQKTPLKLGDRVEVLGFPAQGQYTPLLQDAVYRSIGSGTAPDPATVDHNEALKGDHDCRLVRIEAKLLDRARHSREQFLVLEEGDFIFHAYLDRAQGADAFAELENGSRVAVTGVCLIDPGDWQAGESWRAMSFQVLLRSAGDVVVLRAPPWWNLQKMLWMVGILALIVLAACVWVMVLRRRVTEQTGIIRQRLQAEAALKERYVDLFENANDMVFTHDLTGRVTSINKAGERVLQRRRQEILSQNIVNLVADDQRVAAQQWLGAVTNGAELAAAEWDFVNPTGQRVKLEISARPIEQEGRQVEVEGIARDVTERRRLEREILEISNREQRRIGHDLHDGVCQQLAGIAYRLDILGDRLQDKAVGESSEADKIGSLVNEVNAQARNVARGLFPVRLEENGLISALEEFASNAESRFKIRCRFFCETPPLQVDSEAALHLYYIVQEAVLNAAKHGGATTVVISLKRKGNQFALTVEDDGMGFELPGTSRTGTGMGIRIMRYRAQVIGATLDLTSEPGHGTRLTCQLYAASPETAATPNSP